MALSKPFRVRRARFIVAALVAVLVAVVVPAGQARTGPDVPAVGAVSPTPTAADDLVPAILDLTAAGIVDRSTTVAAESLPPATEIGPGSHLFIRRNGNTYACTANFVWQSGGTQYLGAAGHCFLASNKTATHGPGADASMSGVSVSVCVEQCYFGGQTGFIYTGVEVGLGSVAYARQHLGGNVAGYDFGVVAIPSSLASRVRPSMPVWGGPTGISPTDALPGPVCHYGYGVVFGEAFPTQARTGSGFIYNERYWTGHLASAFGDSGSSVVACGPGTGGLQGAGAVGLITHLSFGTSITLGTTAGQAIVLAREAGLQLTLVTA